MKLYIVKYPNTLPFYLDENLNYTPIPLDKSYPASLVGETPLAGDMILFYSTFIDVKGDKTSVIFSYFQVEREEGGMLYPFEKLSFDSSRAGSGVLNYSKKRTLTRYGSEENIWSLPEFFRCLDLRSEKGSVITSFCEKDGIRYFESKSDILSASVIPSKGSALYYENAVFEWVSSMCEDVRSDATRTFNTLKKGKTGVGKTGFVKYDYAPDSRRPFYCRLNHTVGKRNMKLCESCPMHKKHGRKNICEWSLPLYGASPYIPLTTANAYAYFDVLLEKGLVMDYRD